MDRNKLIERLMATFRGELEEHVRTINEGLLALEKDPEGPGRADRFKTLLRVAHSLKGAARSVGVAPIEEACHRIEEILGAARDGRRALDAERLALLFATADAIEESGMRLREQRDLNDSPLIHLLPRLETEAAGAAAVAPPRSLGPALLSAASVPAPPPAPPPPPPATPPPPVAPERPALGAAFARVPAEKLDAMLACSGELLVARRGVELRGGEVALVRDSLARWRDEWRGAEKVLTKLVRPERAGNGTGVAVPGHVAEAVSQVSEHINRLERDLDRLVTSLGAGTRQLERAAGRLDDEVRRVRMLPFAEACQGLERSVRDVARAGEKQVELVVEGGDVELDRSVLEGLRDPLNHLVRNAVDHGIELPAERQAAGKPAAGQVTVSAALRGTQVEVVVADDGKGLDLDAIRTEARRRGLGDRDDAGELTDLIFLPGFTTTKLVTSISGRGVGLDVVKSRLETLHGTVELAVEPGRGTRFSLVVPLTLTTLRALLIEAGGQVFALASSGVRKLIRVGPADLHTIEGQAMLVRDGAALPVVELSTVLGLAPRAAASAASKRPGLIVAAGDRRVAFLVDELLTEQEIIVKSLGGRVRQVRHVAGATILPNGRIAPVLNGANLVRSALGQGPAALPANPEAAAAGAPAASPRRLLVVDDSITTRTLEKSILEAAGYEVLTATDGEAGWRLLQEQGADLVVTDIEMPRMDGFALTEAIRRSDRFAELPIVLLTSLASDRDRARGAQVGADAYIVKSGFDQHDLIKTIAQLL